MNQRKTVAIILAVCLLHMFGITANALEIPGDTIVYVADTGTKYHREGCTHLKSKNKTTKQAAENAGYSPCSRCKPNLVVGEYTGEKGSGSERGSSNGEGGDKRTLGIDPLKDNEDIEAKKSESLQQEEPKQSNITDKLEIGVAILLVLAAVINGNMIFALISMVVTAAISVITYFFGIFKNLLKRRTVEKQKKEILPTSSNESASSSEKGIFHIQWDFSDDFEDGKKETKCEKENDEEKRKAGGVDGLTDDYWEALLEDVEQKERERKKRIKERKK